MCVCVRARCVVRDSEREKRRGERDILKERRRQAESMRCLDKSIEMGGHCRVQKAGWGGVGGCCTEWGGVGFRTEPERQWGWSEGEPW